MSTRKAQGKRKRRCKSDQEEDYEAERILDYKNEDGDEMFEVQWKGYDEPSWEPIENLAGCRPLIDAFLALKKSEDEDNEEEEYEVEAILASREGEEETEFQVKWKGYEEPTWEPESHLTCDELLRDFKRKKRNRVAQGTRSKLSILRSKWIEPNVCVLAISTESLMNDLDAAGSSSEGLVTPESPPAVLHDARSSGSATPPLTTSATDTPGGPNVISTSAPRSDGISEATSVHPPRKCL